MARRRLPEKLYRIGEVMDFTGLSRQTLHFYATIGLISEKQRTPSGYRLFPPSVFASLERIRKLKKKGFTLREIREILEGHAPRLTTADTRLQGPLRSTRQGSGKTKRKPGQKAPKPDGETARKPDRNTDKDGDVS